MWDDDYEDAREEYYAREAEWYGYDHIDDAYHQDGDDDYAEWARDYDKMRY